MVPPQKTPPTGGPETGRPYCAGNGRNRAMLHAALIALLACLIYTNSLQAPFTFDDNVYILDNPALKDFHYFADPSHDEILMSRGILEQNFRTRVVAFLTFAVNYHLHGYEVFGYHLVNLIIHVLNGWLLYQLITLTWQTPFVRARSSGCQEYRPWLNFPLWAALLFISHPIQTEAVTYISQRFTSLATFFYLLALVTYIRFRLSAAPGGGDPNHHLVFSPGNRRSAIFYGCSLVMTFLAMFTKEISFTLPLAILLYDIFFFSGDLRRRLIMIGPFLTTMVIIPLAVFSKNANYGAVHLFQTSLSDLWGGRLFLYFCTEFRVFITYLRLLALPIGQNLDYDYPIAQGLLNLPVILAFIAWSGLLLVAIYLYARSRRAGSRHAVQLRLIAFGVAIFFLGLSVESSLVPMSDLIFEHRLYLPSLGIFLALVAALDLMRVTCIGSAGRKWLTMFLTALVVIWSGTAQARNTVWQNNVALWRDVVMKSPNKARPHFTLGMYLKDIGEEKEALRELETAAELDPLGVEPLTYLTMARIYIHMGADDSAHKMVDRLKVILTFDDVPHFSAIIHEYLGEIYQSLNRFAEAEQEYKTALAHEDFSIDVYRHLASLYFAQKRFTEAIAILRTAARLEPEDGDIRYNLGLALATTGSYPEAARAFREAITLHPDDTEARDMLAVITGAAGKQGEISGAIR